MIFTSSTGDNWRLIRDSDGALIAERLRDRLIERPLLDTSEGRLQLVYSFPDEVPPDVTRSLLRLLSS